MKVFVCPTNDDLGKFRGVLDAMPAEVISGAVLDVGARSGGFGKLLDRGLIGYVALDLNVPADVIADLDSGLPYGDRAFRCVLALDVLEHTNSIHSSFDELCRVSSLFTVITLPNTYVLEARLRFLRGAPISGKYVLAAEPEADRHRWLMSLKEARAFCHDRARRCDFAPLLEGVLLGPRRGSRPLRYLVERFTNLLAPTYMIVLKRNEQ
jgi:hypothetical protein